MRASTLYLSIFSTVFPVAIKKYVIDAWMPIEGGGTKIILGSGQFILVNEDYKYIDDKMSEEPNAPRRQTS